MIEKIHINRISPDSKDLIEDLVAQECPLTIYLNDRKWVTLLSSPQDLKQLVVGYMYSAEIIKDIKAIKDITIDPEKGTAHVVLSNKDIPEEILSRSPYSSSKGKVKVFKSEKTVECTHISSLMKRFQTSSEVFRKTGGVHSAALSNGKSVVIFKDDISRHNVIDKVVGEALLEGIALEETMLLTSGRVSSEIILKVQKSGCPILVSQNAVTDQAIKLSSTINLTLIGFVRGARMNVYSGMHRILHEPVVLEQEVVPSVEE